MEGVHIMRFRKLVAGTVVTCALVVLSASAFAQGKGPVGPPGGTIYAHDEAYRTVGTPATLPEHGLFDTIYVLGPGLSNVADAAPGDMEYNGGRWEVRPITWFITPTQLTNAEDVEMAAANGDLEIGDVVLRFECPLIPKH
jgi:hypothetical protein